MKSTRQAFGEALITLGETFPHIVVLDADLSKSTRTELFSKKFPERFYQMGIAEANMLGTAAGLAFAGHIPFACSFGCFVTGRYDTIRMSIAYAGAPVCIVGTHAGLAVGEDGHSQMGLEDVGLMRMLPGMAVMQPLHAAETLAVMQHFITTPQPMYLRLTRQDLPEMPLNDSWDPYTLRLIAGNPDASIAVIATGAPTFELLDADTYSLWHATSLKPFDRVSMSKIASKAQHIITAEDHSTLGGLGSIVAEVLAELPKHGILHRCGVQDTFGESGTREELYQKHGISKEKLRALISSL